ncbi:unnamed protein product [Ambrosiozyma monospora]|uniref:Unnamed protein product n=1 Tax=Ambrosiozyma monospora TaxID=43982 RepID=A0ACB5T065_AMBMO|nr:unnamed protein product [Ambrosiozyma monospora]
MKPRELRLASLFNYSIEDLFQSIPHSVTFFYLGVDHSEEFLAEPYNEQRMNLNLLPSTLKLFNFDAILGKHYRSCAQYELCFELWMQNSQDNSELGEFKFKKVPGDDELSRSLQYCIDVSEINFSNGGTQSVTIWKKLGMGSVSKLKTVNNLRNYNC